MGGRAWRNLHTPRIPLKLYLHTRSLVTEALQKVFLHVCVPLEMPSKPDFGDVDFLVAGPLLRNTDTAVINPTNPTRSAFPYDECVAEIKKLLNTTHGRKGHLTDKVMFFAIRDPSGEGDFWIQIDVKVCYDPKLFDWQRFYLNYATLSQPVGNMMKRLGLTMDEEGLYVRVKGLEDVNWEGSKVLVTRDPLQCAKLLGLSWKMVTWGFECDEEVYEDFARSWLFNPVHFGSRRDDESYMSNFSKSNLFFIKTWIPEHYPDYKPKDSQMKAEFALTRCLDLELWYATTALKARERVFSLDPQAAETYYNKRGAFLKQMEENRLRELITAALPVGAEEWEDEPPFPRVVFRSQLPPTPPETPGLEPKPDSMLDP
ncbi:uncharacterized protein EI97DRAFT_366197, partial [Westerdykella ornata]